MEVLTSSKTEMLELPTSAVHNLVRSHNSHVEKYAQHVTRIDGAYQTKFWETWVGGGSGLTEEAFPIATRMEENRLWPVVETIRASLYPRAARAVVMPDYTGAGSAAKTQASLNDWMLREGMQDMILLSILQTLIGSYCAFKVGYEPGTGRPMDRTQLVVCPWWEVMLDRQITCIGQERFYGHLVYKPKQEIEQKYGLKNLRGTRKEEPSPMLNSGSGGSVRGAAGGMSNENQANAAASGMGVGEGCSDGEWVQVLEWFNLVDPLTTRRGNSYKGRMEVYVLGQDPKISDRPIVVEAMPFATPSGKSLPSLVPLIFAHEPFHPFRPISVLDRLMPQVREGNLWATALAQMARRSAQRKGWIKDGAYTGDGEQALLDGSDAKFVHIAEGYNGNVKEAAGFYDPPRIDPTMMENIGRIDKAFVSILGQAPNFRGEVVDATKYETQAANRQTEVALAMTATQLYNTLAKVDVLAVRAFIGCMQDASDSSGGWGDPMSGSSRSVSPDVQVSTVGAVRDAAVLDAAEQDAKSADPKDTLTAPGGVTDAAHVEADVRAAPVPSVPGEATAAVGEGVVATDATATAVSITERPYTVLVDGRPETVTVKDLDASFEITFVESTRSPLREDARKQAQLQLGDKMMKLWEIVQKGGAMAILAREEMISTIEAFELPQTWHPDSLQKALDKKNAEAPPPPPPEEDMAAAGAPMPAEAPAAPPPTAPQQSLGATLHAAREAIASGDLDGGARMVLDVFANDKDALAVFSAAARSPDPKTAMLTILDKILSPADDAGVPPVNGHAANPPMMGDA